MLNSLARFCLNLSDVVKALRELTTKTSPSSGLTHITKLFLSLRSSLLRALLCGILILSCLLHFKEEGEWANGSVDSEHYFARIKDSERNFNGFADPKFAAVCDFIDFLGPDFLNLLVRKFGSWI